MNSKKSKSQKQYITKSRERELIAEVKKSPKNSTEALSELLGAFSGLIRSRVNKFCYSNINRKNLFNAGFEGFYKSILKFDFDRGTRLSTYATFWIDQSISRAVESENSVIRIPKSIENIANKVPLSLNAPLHDENNIKLSEIVIDEKSENPYKSAKNSQLAECFQNCLYQLDDKEMQTIKMRYGLNHNNQRYTLEQVGNKIGVTRERARQIEKKACAKLKKMPELAAWVAA